MISEAQLLRRAQAAQHGARAAAVAASHRRVFAPVIGCERDEPLPISSEFNGTAPAALVVAGVVLFTHTSSCMHVHMYRFVGFFSPVALPVLVQERRRQMEYFPASCPSCCSGKGTEGPHCSSQQWCPHRRGVLLWAEVAQSWQLCCS